MNLLRSLDYVLQETIFWLGVPTKAEFHVNTDQLRRINIPEEEIGLIRATIGSPSGSEYSLGYYPRTMHIGLSAKKKKWEHYPTTYDHACEDPEFFVLRDAFISANNLGRVRDSTRLAMDINVPRGGVGRQSVTIGLHWKITHKHFADYIDTFIDAAASEAPYQVNTIAAVYPLLTRKVASQMNSKDNLQNYGYVDGLFQILLTP